MKFLLQTTPFTRINELIPYRDRGLFDQICQGRTLLKSFHLDGKANSPKTQYQLPLIQKSFVHVISETTFYYPSPFLTEKSFKAITVKRPFIMLGPAESLFLLKSYGFKTFDKWWDESYDQILDPSQRMRQVFDLLSDICTFDIAHCQKLCEQMRSVLEYNFDHYKKHFFASGLDKFCSDLDALN